MLQKKKFYVIFIIDFVENCYKYKLCHVQEHTQVYLQRTVGTWQRCTAVC